MDGRPLRDSGACREGVRGQPLCAQAPPAIPGGGSIDGFSLMAIPGPLVADDAHKGCPRTPSLGCRGLEDPPE